MGVTHKFASSDPTQRSGIDAVRGSGQPGLPGRLRACLLTYRAQAGGSALRADPRAKVRSLLKASGATSAPSFFVQDEFRNSKLNCFPPWRRRAQNEGEVACGDEAFSSVQLLYGTTVNEVPTRFLTPCAAFAICLRTNGSFL